MFHNTSCSSIKGFFLLAKISGSEYITGVQVKGRGSRLDNEIRKQLIREKLKRQFKGKQEITARYHPKYPDSAEREYIRLCNSYMAVEKQVLIKYIPELKQIINRAAGFHMDSASGNDESRKKERFSSLITIFSQIKLLFERIHKELEVSLGLYHLADELKKVAALNHKLTVKEWKKMVSKTLAINLLEDYYSRDFYKEILDKWVSKNVGLIKTISQNSLGKMEELVYRLYMDGKPTTNIVKEIQRQYGISKRHARLIARDQTAKLNADITEHQQRDAGVRRYEWSSSGDERVRRSHRKLDGCIFSWDDPPETDGGRRCHPGQDFQCRCCALPVFDLDEIDLPI